MTSNTSALDERVVLLAPTRKDAAFAQDVLRRAGICCEVCEDIAHICREIRAGAAVVMLTEESLQSDQLALLIELLGEQPSWSDLPIAVLTRGSADSPTARRAVEMLGNVVLLERPVRVPALLSAVRSALRARRRQYEIRGHLEEQRKTAEALRESDRRKDEFLAILAHELRNPLAPIRNSLHLLRMSGGDPGAERVHEVMERQINHMVRLVDDLLEISRINRGKMELRKERVELAAILRSAVETSQPLIQQGDHQLAITLPPEPLILEGDPVRLAQVIANLLNNAAKYTERGGQIWLTARCEEGWAVISVRDTGLGIPAEMLSRVFDMFAQVERTTKRAQGGLGIGLTLARTLVELHGGRIEAMSEGPGRGSEFVVRLPLATPHELTEELRRSPAPRPATRLPPLRVLVVDDNRDAADSLSMILRLLGANTIVAYDGFSALEAIRRHRPAVVFLDIGMPDMDGHEVAERVRADPRGADVVLIALSGWGQEHDRRRSEVAGFNLHLVKPVDLAAVQALLSSLAVPEPAADRAY